MKKSIFTLIALLGTSCATYAQVGSFMAEELQDFNNFLDQANKEYISFLRDPWKEEKAKAPEEKMEQPKPQKAPEAKPATPSKKPSPNKPTPTAPANNPVLQTTGGSVTPLNNTKPQKTKPEASQKPTTPAASTKPTTPVASTKPTTPVASTKPTTPTTPVASTKPTTPVASTTPTTPVASTKPTTPVASTKPTTPVASTKPTTPAASTKPTTPTTPAASTAPAVAAAPVAVQLPLGSLSPYKSTSPFASNSSKVKVNFCGTTLYVDGSLRNAIHVKSTSNNDVANAMESLASNSDAAAILSDVRTASKDMKLNGWCTMLLIKDVAEAVCSNHNAQVLLRLFLLNELGYKAQVAMKSNSLLVLVAPDGVLYGLPRLDIDGTKFYDVDNALVSGEGFMLPQQLSSKAVKKLGLKFTQLPALDTKTVEETRTSTEVNATATVVVAESQMQLYKRYPQCDFDVYATAKVSPTVSTPLLADIKKLVEGKNEQDAVQIILTYIQRAFPYKTDEDQFGYEKPFFVEEMFYYPYDDCEDRSVLFQYIVRNVLNMDVVLLEYPCHLATAVKFSSPVSGADVVNYKGVTYTVCDPTYIGASIGMAQPGFKNVTPQVYKYF